MTGNATIPAVRRTRSRLYVGLGFLIAAIVVVGFWPGYYRALLSRAPLGRPPVIHVHAAVFTGWLVLFAVQVGLAATGCIRAHLRLGQIGAWYGAGLIAVGLYTAVVRSAVLPVGERELLLWVTLVDMAVFSALFGAALWFRRTPPLHRRLMTAAAASLAIASIARMQYLPAPPARLFAILLLWSAPIVLAIAHDFRYTRRLHPVYVVTLVLFVFRLWSGLVVVDTPQWRGFTELVLARVGD